ncbi:hypothetical protein FRC03_012098 [Tulasnella sp. 419]|nr:hypothetical protein FRC02_001335 [Tulasnella sp. 418]KAG8952566.1 hypothetical protein FRC03_012098 [Tulasnella sp. 419]
MDPSSVFESNIQTCEFWEAILHTATMWDSDQLRQHAIQEIDELKPNALRYIHLSKTYNVLKWMEPAFVQLCKKPEPISEEEAASISLPLLLEICQVRERRAAISGHSTCSQCLQPRWMSSSGRSTSTCSKCGCYMTAEGVVEQGAKKLRVDN